ncbi:NifU family protein [Amycolatopsis minnesotensis]|uniref:NifU family protein n=1 Tax=Amycolatopsis minnesotensis TaxID=337894 RepID=A0ABN2QT24_9PSEU
MPKRDDVSTVGERIEVLLTELAEKADPATVELAEDLVHTMVEFYGAGLARVMGIVDKAANRDDLVTALTDDDVVGGLLVLHDLHPLGTEERVRAALDRIRPYLGSHAGDVEYHGIDDEGVLHLSLAGTCDGCPSSTITVRDAIEKAVQRAAPELTGMAVAGVAEPDAGPGGRPLLPLQSLTCPVPEEAVS